jgi:hypothetical protein
MKKHRWNSDQVMSEASIISLYPDSEKYRSSRHKYSASIRFFAAANVECAVYVVAGIVEYTIANEILVANPGEVIALDKSEYLFSVIGVEDADIIKVLKKPNCKDA